MKKKVLLDSGMFIEASIQSLAMLNPVKLYRNPVMFVVEIGSILTTCLAVHAGITHSGEALFSTTISLWLWLTIGFANFAEALAELQGKAQASNLRSTRAETTARLVTPTGFSDIPGSELKKMTNSSSIPAKSFQQTGKSLRVSRALMSPP